MVTDVTICETFSIFVSDLPLKYNFLLPIRSDIQSGFFFFFIAKLLNREFIRDIQ